MMRIKSCPRCRGDLAFVEDLGESYFSCVQCGHIAYAQPAPVLAPAPR